MALGQVSFFQIFGLCPVSIIPPTLHIHSFVLSLVPSFFHAFVSSFIHSFIHSCIQPSIYAFFVHNQLFISSVIDRAKHGGRADTKGIKCLRLYKHILKIPVFWFLILF
jgi:hypothetical protein